MKKFAEACKTGKLKIRDAAAVALAMVYGIRRVEMTRINPKEDINIKNRTILIKTAKKGKVREHYIPNEIFPFVYFIWNKNVRYPIEYFSTSKMVSMCKRAGVEYKPNRAWHAFRRSLVTDLLDLGIPEVKVYDFMRWSRKEVIFKYYLPNPRVIDEEIFNVHPYLPFFRIERANRLML